MKELKRTITTEETYGFEAFDGSVFRSKEECVKYEGSALAVAKKAALAHLVKEEYGTHLYDYAFEEDAILIFDIPDNDALLRINTFIHLSNCYSGQIPAKYVGKRVAVHTNCERDWYDVLGTADEMLHSYTANLTQLFSDPTPTAEKE